MGLPIAAGEFGDVVDLVIGGVVLQLAVIGLQCPVLLKLGLHNHLTINLLIKK